MYADERELLVFRTFLQSGSVPKRFFDTLSAVPEKGTALRLV